MQKRDLPQAAKVPFRAEISLSATLVLIRQEQMIPHSMQGIILGSKACLLHDFPLLSLERLFLGNSELPKSCQTLYTVFSANVLHSMQRIILDSKACILHEVVSPNFR